MVFAVEDEGPGSSSSETGTRSGSSQTLHAGSAIVGGRLLGKEISEGSVVQGVRGVMRWTPVSETDVTRWACKIEFLAAGQYVSCHRGDISQDVKALLRGIESSRLRFEYENFL